MLFPADARKRIADTFYDKTVSVLTKSVITDSEGGRKKTGTIVTRTFKGNVRFTALGEVQNQLGLTENIDVAITCDPATDIAVDSLMQYAGVTYVATDVLPFDSHKLIVGQKWRAQ